MAKKNVSWQCLQKCFWINIFKPMKEINNINICVIIVVKKTQKQKLKDSANL